MKAIVNSLVAALVLTGVGSVTSIAQAGVTGNVNVVSSYNLRGITNTPVESDSPALQGGLDYTHDSGFYAGYWFSTLSYSYTSLNTVDEADDAKKSLENDFYAGYNGKVGKLGYTLGGTIYYYNPGWESTGYETKLGLSYGDFGLTAQTILNDVTFSNKGDTYIVASYTKALPQDFTFSGQLGGYIYTKNGDFIKETADSKSANFRHLILGVTHPLSAKGSTMGLQYIIGGDDRFGVKQDDKVVASLGLTF